MYGKFQVMLTAVVLILCACCKPGENDESIAVPAPANLTCEIGAGEGSVVLHAPGLLNDYSGIEVITQGASDILRATIDTGLWPPLPKDYAELVNIYTNWSRINLVAGDKKVYQLRSECNGVPRNKKKSEDTGNAPVAAPAGPGCVRAFAGQYRSRAIFLSGEGVSPLKVAGPIKPDLESQVFFFHPPELEATLAIVHTMEGNLALKLPGHHDYRP